MNRTKLGLELGISVTFVLNLLMVVFGALYWWFAIRLDTDSTVTPVPDNAKARVLTVRVITFIYSFIVAAWSYRYVAANSKAKLFGSIILLRLGMFLYGVGIGIVYYVAITICPNNDTCRKVAITIQPLLGSLAIVTSVSFGGVLGWLTDNKILKAD